MTDGLKHSPIGASSMHRWSKCPGSIKLSQNVPKTTSRYAEEGTQAHEWAAHFLKNKTWPPGIDAETLEHLCTYVTAINNDLKRELLNKPQGATTFCEQSFDLSSIYPGAFGTADYIIYYSFSKKLVVYDLKFGAGLAVEVKGNQQLRYYGLGALITTGFICDEIELVVVQPRCPHPDGPVRRETLSTMELLEFSADLVDYAKATEDPKAALVSGDHCRFCPAAGICPELHKEALTVTKQEFTPILSYDPKKLAETLFKLPAIEAWTKSVREFAYQESISGRLPPGWKLVAKRSTRRWQEYLTAEDIMHTLGLELDEVTERSLKSPAQIEKVIATEDKPLVAKLVVSASSGSTLVPESDPREAVRNDPTTEFSVIIN